jgi:ubiquinone/menaquinone biosynthesis C-methylase UbiE
VKLYAHWVIKKPYEVIRVMPNHDEIYRTEAEQYERLISTQPNLSEIVESIVSYADLDIIDLGAGTGRLSCVLAGKAKSILLLDQSEAMLKVAAQKLAAAHHTNWHIQKSDHRKIQAESQSADLVVSGWSLCYLASSPIQDWEQNLQLMQQEIKRVLRPGGTVIIFETMGTGAETPDPPDFLRQYYEQLEVRYGFSYQWIRTDYHFKSVIEAEQLTSFFFGENMAKKVTETYGMHLPECAGVWHRSF